jgi:hypothetical protein
MWMWTVLGKTVDVEAGKGNQGALIDFSKNCRQGQGGKLYITEVHSKIRSNQVNIVVYLE